MKELGEEQFIAHNAKTPSRQRIFELFAQHHTPLNISIELATLETIKDFVKDLEKAGLSVGNVNDQIQSISGAAGDEAVEMLRRVPGVVDVSPDQPIDIGPPDSPETW